MATVNYTSLVISKQSKTPLFSCFLCITSSTATVQKKTKAKHANTSTLTIKATTKLNSLVELVVFNLELRVALRVVLRGSVSFQ